MAKALELKNKEFKIINEETGEREILKLTDDQIKLLVKLKPVDYDETVEKIPSLQACLVKDDIDKILSILNN